MIREGEWTGLEARWDDLLERSPAASFFLTREWLTSWWEAYGAGRELFLLTVERDGRLIGAAPLYLDRERRLGHVPYRSLRLVGDGSGDSDYLDWISESGSETEVVHALLGDLARQPASWDLLLLNEVQASSPHRAPLEADLRARGWRWRTSEVPCTRVDLPTSWEEYLRVLRPRMRTKTRSLLRAWDADSRARFDRCERREDLRSRLDSLYELHNRRWERDGKLGVFHSSARRAFYETLSPQLLERGRLRLYSLAVDNRFVAHQFCFEYRNQLLLLQEGYDPDLEREGVGNALRAMVFRDCIRHGLSAYDFLGGVTEHKLAWGARAHPCLRITIGRRTLRTTLLFGVADARGAARAVYHRLRDARR